MKKLLILFLIVFASCEDNTDRGLMETQNTTKSITQDYRVITIEGCEYIIYDRSSGYSGYGFMAHKGNCRNH